LARVLVAVGQIEESSSARREALAFGQLGTRIRVIVRRHESATFVEERGRGDVGTRRVGASHVGEPKQYARDDGRSTTEPPGSKRQCKHEPIVT
jgi:hypothetical protein